MVVAIGRSYRLIRGRFSRRNYGTPPQKGLQKMGQEFYFGRNFTRDVCPICGEAYSRCGLPNHIRRHSVSAQRSKRKAAEGRSAAWWEGWKEGYRTALRDSVETGIEAASDHPSFTNTSALSRRKTRSPRQP